MRLIDADVAIENIEEWLNSVGTALIGKGLSYTGELMGCIEDTPTIDAAPVRHGRWVGLEYDGYADGYPVYNLWECSECGEEVRGEDVPSTHPYCHGCGAVMDLEE